MCDLARRVEQVTEKEIEETRRAVENAFVLAESVAEEDFRWAMRVAAGLDRLVKDLDSSICSQTSIVPAQCRLCSSRRRRDTGAATAYGSMGRWFPIRFAGIRPSNSVV